MLKLAETAAEGTAKLPIHPDGKPPPHPAYLASIREGALLSIKNGVDLSRYTSAGAGEDITKAIAALRAEGVGPEKAARMLARLEAGRGLYVIPGGGEPSETAPRVPRLRLVRGGAT